MLDLKFVRENTEVVKQNIKNKFQDKKLPLVDEVIELDAQARATQTEADELRSSRNKLSKQIGALMAQGKKEEAEAVRNAKVTYFLDLETFFEYYALFNKSELAKYLGINPSLLRRLSTSANVELSEKKALQIKNGLHKLAAELQHVDFA